MDGKPSKTGSVTLLESRSVISASGTTGLRTWEAALLLGSFLASQSGQDIIRDKTILELGAGTGLLSILCAKHLRVSGVLATDGDEAVVDAIKTNAFLNEENDSADLIQGSIRTAALKWGRYIRASTFAEDYGIEIPDVVLGADVVSYSKGNQYLRTDLITIILRRTIRQSFHPS
jgi:predicted nicotinamide N-methyase